MVQQNLIVRSPDPKIDTPALIELAARTFGRYYEFRRNLREWYLLGGSHYDYAASAIGYLGDELITHFGVWGYDMRLGNSTIRCGGIGCVATDGEYRKQGLMERTVPHSLTAMHRCGYDLSILFGVHDFYHRFGYVRAWNEANWFIALDQLPKDLPAVTFESFRPEPRPDIAKRHNQHSRNLTGSAIRPTYTSPKYVRPGHEGYLWRNRRGQLAGYVVVRENAGRLSCFECTGQPDEILSVLKAIAAKMSLRELQFETLHYTTPIAKCLRRLSCRMERRYVKSGDAMVRVINLESTISKMIPAFEHRLANSELASYKGDLTIQYLQSATTLSISRGKVKTASGKSQNLIRGGHGIASLLLGTDEPFETCESHEIRLTGEAARLVPTLFPNEHPQLQAADRY